MEVNNIITILVCRDNKLAESHIKQNCGNGSIIYLRPENDLFPLDQADEIKRIVRLCNAYNCEVWVHTHSPYILSQLNSLLKAGRLAEQFKDDEVKLKQIEAIIPRKYWLPRKNVNVYKMECGTVIPLIDKEDGIIAGGYLDSLSDKLMKDYDDLLDIQYPSEGE